MTIQEAIEIRKETINNLWEKETSEELFIRFKENTERNIIYNLVSMNDLLVNFCIRSETLEDSYSHLLSDNDLNEIMLGRKFLLYVQTICKKYNFRLQSVENKNVNDYTRIEIFYN